MCLQPSASHPMAVTMAVEETCPSLPRFTHAAPGQRWGIARSPRGLAGSSPTSASRLLAMLLAWSFESLPVPILPAILWTFLVLVPVPCISATAAMSALPVLWQRSRMSSGKKLPRLNLGILRSRVPTQVLSFLGL